MSICHCLIEMAWENENAGAVITIARKTFPSSAGLCYEGLL